MQEYSSLLTNCVLVDKGTEIHLFGEVVTDTRFPTGHHIFTSPIVSWNPSDMLGKTKSGTVYKVEKLYSIEEYKEYVNQTYTSKSYCDHLLFCIGAL